MIVGFRANRRNSRIFRDLRGICGATRRAIRQTWYALGKDLKAAANQEILNGKKSGKLYIVHIKGRRRKHRASAPGESHANLTGKLRKSIGWKVHGSDKMDFGYGFTRSAPEYAAAIEFGRRDGTIEPRPSLDNAVRAVDHVVQNHFNRHMLKIFKPRFSA